MVFPGNPSHSQLDDKHQKPTQPQEPAQSPNQRPQQSETLDFPNPPHSLLHDQIVLTSQQSDNEEDILTIMDGNNQQMHQKDDQLSKNPLRSPTNRRVRSTKWKKGSGRKITENKRVMKKVENLTDTFNPIPFIPRALDLDKYEDVVKRLELYDFTKIEFDRSIRTDLLVQLIVNFDSKKRCSYVNGQRIRVSRADLARALKLPKLKEKRNRQVEEVDLDSEVFSDEVIGFVEDFVFNWMLIHDESWDLPIEIVNWTKCIRDGHPEKLDSASLIWYKVEKELTQGDKLGDCYYASHLQCLIRSQKHELFKEEDGGDEAEEVVKVDEEHDKNEEKEVEVSIVQERDVDEGEEIVKYDEELEEKEEQEVKISIVQERDVDEGEEIVKADKEHDEKEEQEVKVVTVQERDVDDGEEFVKDNEEHDKNEQQEVKVSIVQERDVDDGEEIVKDDEELEEKEEQEVKVTIVQERDVDDSEEIVKADEEHDEKEEEEKVAVVQERDVELTLGPDVEKTVHQMVKEHDETMMDTEKCDDETMVNWKNGLSEHILQRCQHSDLKDFEEIKVEEVKHEQIQQMEDEDVQVVQEDDAGERFIEGFGIEANDDSVENFHGVSNFDLFTPRDNSFMSDEGPSFFNNGGKRLMDPEENTQQIDGNSKRLKTNEMYDHQQNEFGDCMEQMQQWIEKAKMIQQSKEISLVNSQCHQNFAIGQMQERNQMLEMVIKSRDEELKKKNAEMFVLERELYLMIDLLSGYRKALNDTRFKFKEYRRRVALQEEPVYKDAGPSGLVLSTRDLEKRRLKEEEFMMKFQSMVKSYEDEGVYQLNIQSERVLKMDEKLVFVGNEVKKLKEIVTQRKVTQKLHDEVSDDASKEIVACDDDETKEKGGGEEH